MSEVLPFTRPKAVGIQGLRNYKQCFLSTPYSLYEGGLQKAFEDACRLAARLMLNGLTVYSPIAHSHPIAKIGGINPLDHKFWVRQIKHALEGSDALLVAEMSGWKNSIGMKHEMDYMALVGRPIYFINPNSLAIR